MYAACIIYTTVSFPLSFSNIITHLCFMQYYMLQVFSKIEHARKKKPHALLINMNPYHFVDSMHCCIKEAKETLVDVYRRYFHQNHYVASAALSPLFLPSFMLYGILTSQTVEFSWSFQLFYSLSTPYDLLV